jgi:hypothetical protein
VRLQSGGSTAFLEAQPPVFFGHFLALEAGAGHPWSKSITLTWSKTLHVLNISTVILGSPICGSDDHEMTIVRRVWLRFSEHLPRGGFKSSSISRVRPSEEFATFAGHIVLASACKALISGSGEGEDTLGHLNHAER